MFDEKSKKSLKAGVWYIITNFMSKVLIYIFTPLYTRVLTTAEYGEYSNFLSWQSILVTLITFDLSAAVGIAYYDYKDEKNFDGFINTISVCSYLIPGFFCTIIFILREFYCDIFSMKAEHLSLLLVYITFNNTLNIFQGEQRVRLKYKLSAILTLITSALTVISTLLFVFLFKDKLRGVLLGGVLVNTIVSFILAIRIWSRSHDVKWEYLRYALVIAVPLIPHALAGAILGSSDKVMITRYCGEVYTALYNLAYTVSMVITMVASSINKAWSPWFCDRLSCNRREHIKMISNILVTVIAVASFIVCLLAPEILLLIGGKTYVSSAVLMPPVITACLVNCVSTFYINIEFYNKKTIGISIATVISASLNVLMNYIFIRKFGYIAAAYTTLACSVITLVFHLYKVNRQGMSDVFDNKLLLSLLGVFIVLSEMLMIIYNSLAARCVVLLVLLMAVGGVMYKHRKRLRLVVDNMMND